MALRERLTNASPPPRSMAIFWLGQGGFIFKSSGGTTVFVDPYLSEVGRELRRLAPIPLQPGEVEGDIVLFTHNHLDHLDENTVPGIAEGCRTIKFGGSRECLSKAKGLGIPEERLVYIELGETIEVGDFKVSAVFAEHTGGAVGYVLDCGGPITYITGDTLLCPELEEVRRFRPGILIVCINGRAGNMSAHEAAYLTRVLRPHLAIPMHYGMFVNNTLDPQEFVEALRIQQVGVRAFLLELGGGYIFDGQANLLERI